MEQKTSPVTSASINLGWKMLQAKLHLCTEQRVPVWVTIPQQHSVTTTYPTVTPH